MDYRQRQRGKGNNTKVKKDTAVRVFARARPLFSCESERGEWDCVTADSLLGDLVVHSGSQRITAGKGVVLSVEHQIYPGITPVITDKDVYEAVRYLVEDAVGGGRSTLFMYGMTGSGKTHSMAGIHERVPTDLFRNISGVETIKLAAFELVGKKCFDLLSESDDTCRINKNLSEGDGSVAAKTEIFLRIGEDSSTHMCGNTEHSIANADELHHKLRLASNRRETSATRTNTTSSRSHAVYQLSLPNGGRFLMIDLAGSPTVYFGWSPKARQ
jgi:kinesin family protein 2/24